MRLSIIIPAYNVEDTLRTCVESACITTFPDWEVILVDDGSTDATPALCDQLATENYHIRVIHKANGGLSEARNVGIDAASGDYLAFIDSDDYLSPGTLDDAVATMESHPEYDLLEFPVAVYHGGPHERMLCFKARSYSAQDYWIDGEAYSHSYACNKVYKRRLFDDVRYPVGRLFEDMHTLPSLLEKAHTIGTTDKGLYYYNYNPKGITSTADGKALSDLLDAHMRVLCGDSPLLAGKDIENYYAHVLNIQLDVYERTGKQPVLPAMPFRGTLKLRLLQLIGMKNLCRCNKLLHKVVKPSR